MSKPTERATGGRQRPTSSKGSKSRLARRLWEWAIDEMKYSGGEEGALRQEDLQVLVRGELAGLLEFAAEHVKSPSKAEIIQGNLLLHNVERGGGGGGGEVGRGEMERERSRLAREETSLRMAVEQMTKDVAQLRERITQLAEAGVGVQGEGSRLSQGTVLLSAHSHLCQETTRTLQEFTHRIRARAELFNRPKGREACYFTRQDAGVKCWSEETVEESERGGGGCGTVLESACTHSVRVICSQLEETLSGSHSGGQRSFAAVEGVLRSSSQVCLNVLHFPLFQTELQERLILRKLARITSHEDRQCVAQHINEVERKKGTEHSWRQIESLLTQHTPGEILSSLEEVTQQTTSHLHSHTLSIDLTRDAQHLKYSYDSQCGGMKDLAQQPSLLHAVEEQLLEAQLSHIRRSIESECARNAAGAARARATELQTQALQLLQEMYRDLPDGQQEALELAKQLYTRLELECAGSAAALERLRSLCSSLDDARNQRRRAVTDLQNRLRKIQEFAQVAESKQKEIRALVAHNSSARDRLQTQYRELQRYVEQHVLGHHDELTRAAGILRDSVAHEVQAFSGLSLHRMLKPPSSQVPTCDLSINGLGRKQPSGHPSWAVVTRSLSLPPNAAPDRALAQLLAAQERVCRLEGNVSEVNQALQQMRLAAVNKDNTQDVLQRCKEHDSRLLETAIPALQECLSRASSGLADCERTAETLDHWWNQPAQFLTPWATQAGFSTQQWVDQWRVLTAKFSELQGLQH